MAEERDEVTPLPYAPAPVTPTPLTPATNTGGDRGELAGTADAAVAGAAGSDDPEEIREQIERTREDMSLTLDELQERLSPQHLAQQAKDTVREATVGRVQHMVESAGTTASEVAERAQDTAGTIVERAREYPIPVALVGAGLVWWMMRGSSSNGGTSSRSGPSWRTSSGRASYPGAAAYDAAYDEAGYDVGSEGGRDSGVQRWTGVLTNHPVPTTLAVAGLSYWLMNRGSSSTRSYSSSADRYGSSTAGYAARDRGEAYTGAGDWRDRSAASAAGDVARGARERVGAVGEQVSDTVQQVSDKVRNAQEQVRDTAAQVTRDVSRKWQSVRRRSSSQFETWMNENPLAVGVAAFAAGALVGLSVPRTETEDQVLGSSRDKLMDMAGDTAQSVKEQVKDKVQEVARDVTGASSSSTESPQA